MDFSPCVSCASGRKLPSHTPHTLTPVPLSGLACSAEGVRRVTLTPLTPGKT
ncbi:hypothetical protein ACQ74_gp43 [Propionibacterium phage PHL095N00]|uniref:Uncharacterized protein n=1 Tax=Propionibacterium phage PHL095N00 TaxID=1500814 RepID=A0A0E3DN57_9CAUD|nr:hypothetical protein ACQ74_gp43 [Propionibacterium phage PHL095N00]AII29351.1 hypothetical protein PHL095N00_43 [Propionibacterium phage PHL095N00]